MVFLNCCDLLIQCHVLCVVLVPSMCWIDRRCSIPFLVILECLGFRSGQLRVVNAVFLCSRCLHFWLPYLVLRFALIATFESNDLRPLLFGLSSWRVSLFVASSPVVSFGAFALMFGFCWKNVNVSTFVGEVHSHVCKSKHVNAVDVCFHIVGVHCSQCVSTDWKRR